MKSRNTSFDMKSPSEKGRTLSRLKSRRASEVSSVGRRSPRVLKKTN